MTILHLRLLLSLCFVWEDISNTQNSVSSAIQTPRISSKILPLRVVFSTLFSVFRYPDETLFLVFDILRHQQKFYSELPSLGRSHNTNKSHKCWTLWSAYRVARVSKAEEQQTKWLISIIFQSNGKQIFITGTEADSGKFLQNTRTITFYPAPLPCQRTSGRMLSHRPVY